MGPNSGSGKGRSAAKTREGILRAAGTLFYREGIRAVSVDAVAERAGVTKRTLYYHFRSKDDLIAAYLDSRDEPNLAAFRRWYADTSGGVAEKVEGVFCELSRAVRHPKWKGCGFLRTTVELIALPGHPALAVARRHKNGVEDWLGAELQAICPPEQAQSLARQVVLLMDGAFSLVMLHRDPAYMDQAGKAAVTLIGAAQSQGKAS